MNLEVLHFTPLNFACCFSARGVSVCNPLIVIPDVVPTPIPALRHVLRLGYPVVGDLGTSCYAITRLLTFTIHILLMVVLRNPCSQ